MKKNGFTLIELLAIIVILAIIAIITVPIVLNVIENSKIQSVTDSAYGYKDSIQKYYLSKVVEDTQQELPTGTYNITSLPSDFTVSGESPSEGWVQLNKGQVVDYSLKFGDYVVSLNTTTNTPESIKNGKLKAQSSSVPTIASCPGCKFIYTTANFAIEGSSSANDYSTDMPTAQDGLTDDYTTLIGTEGHPYFLGLIESTTTSGKIGRAFVCGIENDTPFCLEGYDTSKWSDNVGVLNTIFPDCDASASGRNARCNGSSVNVYTIFNGHVNVNDADASCTVLVGGRLLCIVSGSAW